ncbi:protein trapped in endoderm-1-like [Pollicipes pollicipes]|uniref:protein trapped in endoderm-1-like n=1 Tax=Pollicipes pollicipes TaxID=41117 RepID=UPI001884ED8C|nr:protein trapped in endoderm-1-like [Pollicipes pollicipes]
MLGAANGPVAVLSTALHVDSGTSSDDDDGLHDWARDMVKGVCCMVAVLGGVGNLLTLTAVPYASRCCRAPREVKRLRYSTATVFILNLAVADLLYCLVNLPLYYLQYSRPSLWRDPAHGFACPLAGVLRYTNAAADWMSLAGIAFNRCVCLLSIKWKGRIFGGWKSYVIIALIWLYGFLTQGLSLFQVYGEYGWNNLTRKCDFLKDGNGQPRTDWFLISWSIPCAVILVSYSLIFVKVKQSGRTILRSSKHQRMEHVEALLKTREDKTSRMIFVVFVTYCICVLPITVVNVADPYNKRPYVSIICYCIYWLQYCCNNIIYVVSNGVYRKAYIIFLTEVIPPLKRILKRPVSWQVRQSTAITTITGHTLSTRSFSPLSRQLQHTDSLRFCGESSARQAPGGERCAGAAAPGTGRKRSMTL